MARLTRLWSDRRGSAAAELALVSPLLILLMFSSFEVGKFFWDEHTVTKAVRDGARYAGRQGFAAMPCGGSATNQAAIRNVVRYGTPVVGQNDQPLLCVQFFWMLWDWAWDPSASGGQCRPRPAPKARQLNSVLGESLI